MLSFQTREWLENTFNQVRWIALAMLGSLFVEAIVVEMIHWFFPFEGFATAEEGLSPSVQYVLIAVGLSDLVFLPFLRRSMLAARGDHTEKRLIARLRAVAIVTLAIAHFPALMGMVIFVLWTSRWAFYLLWGVSLIVMLAYFPRLRFWEEWISGGGRMEV